MGLRLARGDGLLSANVTADSLVASALYARHDHFQPKAAAIRSTPEFDLVLDIPKVEEDPARKQKEIEQLKKNIANSERQLNDPVFMSKAPAKVIDTIRAKLADYKAQLEKLL